MKKYRKTLVEYSILLLVMLVFALCYHFDTIKSGFKLLPGDFGDAFLNVLAADSWGEVFRGETGFRQNRMFYPFAEARGFTDLSLSLFLLQLPWRIIYGLGMFSSALAVYLVLFHFGILSMFYLLRRVLHLNFAAALGGAILSFYNNAVWGKLLHTQFFFLGLLPLLAICVIRYCQLWNSQRTAARVLYGAGAVLVFSAIASSNYYTAFFAGLAGAIYFVIYFVLLAKRKKLKEVFIWQRLGEVILLAVWGALLFIPFFYTYFPVMTNDYQRVWTAAQGTLPTLADIFNIGSHNLLWGKLYDYLFPPVHKHVYENLYGLPLITAGVFFYCIWHFWKERKKQPPAMVALAAMLAVLYVISVKFYHCVSLWYFVWKYVPGGSAIRAGGRVYVFMMFPVMVFMWYSISRISMKYPRRKQLLLCGILFAVLALDNINTIRIYAWEPGAAAAAAEEVPLPPAQMKCFYLDSSCKNTAAQKKWVSPELQAWYMARRFKSFTINGYSGNVPMGYQQSEPFSDDYKKGISHWVKQHKLDGVFSYDIASGSWRQEEF